MLQLKEQQLQREIGKIHQGIEAVASQVDLLRKQVVEWVDVFGEEVNLTQFFKIREIKTETGNIAGIDIPLFLDVEFEEKPYDLMWTPVWVDKAIGVCKQMVTLNAKLSVYHKQLHILKEELRIATQRVNLFEKVKIPRTRENIRVINIYLGELQTQGVVRGKIAKAKIERRKI